MVDLKSLLDVCNVPYPIHLLDVAGNVLFELLVLIMRKKLLLLSESSKEPLTKAFRQCSCGVGTLGRCRVGSFGGSVDRRRLSIRLIDI